MPPRTIFIVSIQTTTLKLQPDSADSWQYDLAQAYTRPEQLAHALELDSHWLEHHRRAIELFPMRVPRPFVKLMEVGNPNDPLLLQVLPQLAEFEQRAGFSTDPLEEQQLDSPRGLLHKYKSRVLILLKGGCAVNCRYCFRRHFPYQEHRISHDQWQAIDSYIADNTDINEVILSGGDPLMAKDYHLIELLDRIESHQHVKRVRIHSRLPVVIPSRLTSELLHRLAESRLHAILVLHINHPNEISDVLRQKLEQARKCGIQLFNQSVLLANINDSSDVLVALSERLFDAGVLPYYLHQMDKVQGAAHFCVSDERAQHLMRELLAELPGFLVPKLVRELGGEASKTPIPF